MNLRFYIEPETNRPCWSHLESAHSAISDRHCGGEVTLPRPRQLERSSRFPQDRDRPMTIASLISFCPEFIQRAIEGQRVVGDDENRAVVQLKDVKFHPTTGVPCVYIAKVCRVDRVLHREILHEA